MVYQSGRSIMGLHPDVPLSQEVPTPYQNEVSGGRMRQDFVHSGQRSMADLACVWKTGERGERLARWQRS